MILKRVSVRHVGDTEIESQGWEGVWWDFHMYVLRNMLQTKNNDLHDDIYGTMHKFIDE